MLRIINLLKGKLFLKLQFGFFADWCRCSCNASLHFTPSIVPSVLTRFPALKSTSLAWHVQPFAIFFFVPYSEFMTFTCFISNSLTLLFSLHFTHRMHADSLASDSCGRGGFITGSQLEASCKVNVSFIRKHFPSVSFSSSRAAGFKTCASSIYLFLILTCWQKNWFWLWINCERLILMLFLWWAQTPPLPLIL